MKSSCTEPHFKKPLNDLIHETLKKYPLKVIISDNFCGNFSSLIYEYIIIYLDGSEIFNYTPEEIIYLIQRAKTKHINFFEYVVAENERKNITIRIKEICPKLFENVLKTTREEIYNIMWFDGKIRKSYGDDFVFDINDFGYEIVIWNEIYYVCSGMLGI